MDARTGLRPLLLEATVASLHVPGCFQSPKTVLNVRRKTQLRHLSVSEWRSLHLGAGQTRLQARKDLASCCASMVLCPISAAAHMLAALPGCSLHGSMAPLDHMTTTFHFRKASAFEFWRPLCWPSPAPIVVATYGGVAEGFPRSNRRSSSLSSEPLHREHGSEEGTIR